MVGVPSIVYRSYLRPRAAELCFHGTPVDNGFVRMIAVSCPALRRLDISGSRAIAPGVAAQLGLGCPNLAALDISGCPNLTNASLYAIMRALPNLTELRMADCTGRGLTSLRCLIEPGSWKMRRL